MHLYENKSSTVYHTYLKICHFYISPWCSVYSLPSFFLLSILFPSVLLCPSFLSFIFHLSCILPPPPYTQRKRRRTISSKWQLWKSSTPEKPAAHFKGNTPTCSCGVGYPTQSETLLYKKLQRWSLKVRSFSCLLFIILRLMPEEGFASIILTDSWSCISVLKTF